MSKIAQVECKAKACFLALLRRSRFSSVAQGTLVSGLLSFRQCKVRDKKKATEVNFHRLGVFQSFSWSFACFCQNSGENSGKNSNSPEFFQSF